MDASLEVAVAGQHCHRSQRRAGELPPTSGSSGPELPMAVAAETGNVKTERLQCRRPACADSPARPASLG
jgi:hypothetical protein